MYKVNRKYHFIYKTTNLLSGRYYIGMHSTDNLDDGYLGSGSQLINAIKKHGKDNFVREILEFCSTREELHQKEEMLVTLNEVRNKDCMNMKVGGLGKWPESANEAFKHNLQNDPALKESFRLQGSNHFKDLHKKGHFKYDTFKGRSHSEETKEKMRNSANGFGETNSQYGKCWITNGKENKKIQKGGPIPEGFSLGRKIKNPS
jgi:hypothetical protein